MVLPFSDFVLPGLIPAVVLLIATGTISVLLYALEPPLTQRMVLAFVPWVVSGAILHVFWQLQNILQRQLYPTWAEVFFSAPAVYLTTFIAVGTIWALSATIVPSYDYADRMGTYIFATGMGVFVPLLALLLWQGLDESIAPMEPVFPVLGLIIALVLTFVVYVLIGAWRTYVMAEARWVGALVLFAHIFDGVTTAIGVDVLEGSERSVAPQIILDFAADLPTADVIGVGWLFVLFKVILASLIVILFADYVSEKPTEGNLFLALVAVFGLGPATNNFFLFLLSP